MKGQAKKDFEKWVGRADLGGIGDFSDCVEMCENYPTDNWNISFTDYPKSMQYGVIVDWFDSVGIEIYFQCDETLIIFDNGEPVDLPFRQFDTRQQARQKAIDKAVEIYNER
jgi:hypothetical protein